MVIDTKHLNNRKLTCHSWTCHSEDTTLDTSLSQGFLGFFRDLLPPAPLSSHALQTPRKSLLKSDHLPSCFSWGRLGSFLLWLEWQG